MRCSVITLLWFFLGLASVAHAQWVRETAHDATWGEPPLVALDATDSPILAVGLKRLVVARRDGLGWRHDPVIDACGATRSIDHHPTGGTAIVFEDGRDSRLLLAWERAGEWEIHELRTEHPARRGGIEVVFDPTGAPLVAHVDEGVVRVLRWSGSDWLDEELGVGEEQVLAGTTDSDGNPVFLYGPDRTRLLELATWTGATWTFETLDPGVTGHRAVDLDYPPGSTRPNLLLWTEPDLYLVEDLGPRWATDRVERLVRELSEVSLEHAGDGTPFVTADGLSRIYRREAGTWNESSFEVTGLFGPAPMAVDSTGAVLVGGSTRRGIATDPVDHDVHLWRWDSGTFVDEIPGGDAELGLSQLVVNDDGETFLLAVTRYLEPDRLVLAQRRDDGPWTSQLVATGVALGERPMVLDAAGNPVIAWTEDSGLFVARRVAGVLETRAVLPGTQMISPYLAIAPTGEIALLVRRNDGVDAWITYLVEDGAGGWEQEDVFTMTVFDHPAVALGFDRDGSPLVAHASPLSGLHLELSRRGPGGWTTERITPSVSPINIDLEWGPDGALHVAHANFTFNGLARERDGGWEIFPRLYVSARAVRAPLAFGPAGEPVLLAQSVDDGPVLGRWLGSTWSVEQVDSRSLHSTALDLVTGPDGELLLGYDGCGGRLFVAQHGVTILRTTAATTSPGWTDGVLPLTFENDIELAPFPAFVQTPAEVRDNLPGEALTCYLAVGDAGASVAPLLRVSKEGTDAIVRYE
ncbi:MAG: hypothetical protein AAF533_04160 [Acidobacteriota bacterium]